MSETVICIVSNVAQTDNIVSCLYRDGFDPQDISMIAPDNSSLRDLGHEKHSKAPEGTATGASAGAIIGGALGLLAGIGSLAIPGAGPFIAAGPIMGFLSGAAVGGAVGGVAGGLIGLGLPEYEAKQYEAKLNAGNILLSIHCEDGDEAKRCEQILKDNAAEDIKRVGESKVPHRKAS